MKQASIVQAEIVHILVGKGKLEPDIAVAFVEAIDMAIANARLVTVVVLDARFEASLARIEARFKESEAATNARFAALEARMDARFKESEATTNARFKESEAANNARFVALEARMDARFNEFEARFEAFKAEVNAQIERCKSELVRWVFLVMLGNVALSAGATALLNAIQHVH